MSGCIESMGYESMCYERMCHERERRGKVCDARLCYKTIKSHR